MTSYNYDQVHVSCAGLSNIVKSPLGLQWGVSYDCLELRREIWAAFCRVIGRHAQGRMRTRGAASLTRSPTADTAAASASHDLNAKKINIIKHMSFLCLHEQISN